MLITCMCCKGILGEKEGDSETSTDSVYDDCLRSEYPEQAEEIILKRRLRGENGTVYSESRTAC